MKIAVIGSREGFPGNPSDLIEKVLELENLTKDQITIVSGGARGVDSLAESWARSNNVNTLIFRADWKNLGKGAGYIRNHNIIENSDIVLALWNGESRGTLHSLCLSRKLGKKVYLITNSSPLHIADPSELPEKLNYRTNK